MSVPPKFNVEFTGNIVTLTKRIIHALITIRTKKNKPCVICLVGKSGEGKSNTGLCIADFTLEIEGIDFSKYVGPAVVMSAREFGPKVKKLLRDKDLKECFILIIDEAKATVNSADWSSAVNRTISMINSLSRALKPMAIIVIAQSLKDIDKATRDTIDYYGKVTRDDEGVHLKLYEFWVDDHDLDNPKTRKRIVRGQIKTGSTTQMYELNNILFGKVRKEVWDVYNNLMYEAKDKLIENEFDKMDKFLQEKYSTDEMQRVEKVAKYLIDNNKFSEYGSFKYNKWRLNKEFKENFNFIDSQTKELENRMTSYLKAKGEKSKDLEFKESDFKEEIILGGND